MFKVRHLPQRGYILFRTMIIAYVMAGFMGELTLQGLARPHERPRTEIARLLGVDIAPMAASSAHHLHDHQKMPFGHHDHHGCALCFLLTLAVLILPGHVVPCLAAFPVMMRRRAYVLARAPPFLFFPRPMGHGPPCFS